LTIYAGPRRRLDVLDPAGRELLISVGAALFATPRRPLTEVLVAGDEEKP
jgi:hypothetical protein